jgi:hypothetical protein
LEPPQRRPDTRCAQPQNRGRQAFAAPILTRISPGSDSHAVDSKNKNPIVEKIANPCAGPIRRALATLARRCSTTLSTTFVDKKKFANTSPVYPLFLHAMTTTAGKS